MGCRVLALLTVWMLSFPLASSVHYIYGMVKGTASLPCGTISTAKAITSKFDWYDPADRSVTDAKTPGRARYFVSVVGQLEIADLWAHDTGEYKCVVTMKQASQELRKTFRPTLLVYSLPSLTLKAVSTYKITKKCTIGIQLTYYLILKYIMEKLLCSSEKQCMVFRMFLTCRKGKSSVLQIHNIKFAMEIKSNLNFMNKNQIGRVQKLLVKHLKLLLHLDNYTRQPIMAKSDSFKFYIKGSQKLHVYPYLLCDAGFGLQHTDSFARSGLCLPCSVDHYSPPGKRKCYKCPVGTYQPLLASGRCLPCKSGTSTECTAETVEMMATEENRGLALFFMLTLSVGIIIGTMTAVVCVKLCQKLKLGKRVKKLLKKKKDSTEHSSASTVAVDEKLLQSAKKNLVERDKFKKIVKQHVATPKTPQEEFTRLLNKMQKKRGQQWEAENQENVNGEIPEVRHANNTGTANSNLDPVTGTGTRIVSEMESFITEDERMGISPAMEPTAREGIRLSSQRQNVSEDFDVSSSEREPLIGGNKRPKLDDDMYILSQEQTPLVASSRIHTREFVPEDYPSGARTYEDNSPGIVSQRYNLNSSTIHSFHSAADQQSDYSSRRKHRYYSALVDQKLSNSHVATQPPYASDPVLAKSAAPSIKHQSYSKIRRPADAQLYSSNTKMPIHMSSTIKQQSYSGKRRQAQNQSSGITSDRKQHTYTFTGTPMSNHMHFSSTNIPANEIPNKKHQCYESGKRFTCNHRQPSNTTFPNNAAGESVVTRPCNSHQCICHSMSSTSGQRHIYNRKVLTSTYSNT